MEYINAKLRREILDCISRHQNALKIEDLRAELKADAGQLRAVLRNMTEDGLVLQRLSTDAYAITNKGIEALGTLEEMTHKEAEAKARQRFQDKVSIAGVLVPAIAFVLGVLVEHYTGILRLFGL